MRPTALILRTAGTNCDTETAFAFERAGAQPRLVHLNRVLENPKLLDQAQILAIPGGFSYGDDIAAGRIFASQIRHHLRDAMLRFVQAGKPIIGICNGFQVLVQTELLPGPIGDRRGQLCTLAHNDGGRFIDCWVRVAPRSGRCIWTRDLSPAGVELPVAHGEGKFLTLDDDVRQHLWRNDQVALIYALDNGESAGGRFPANPNGSVDDVAGICDTSGLVLGLMPHPERHVDRLQHPAWTREESGVGPGLQMFRNAVNHVC